MPRLDKQPSALTPLSAELYALTHRGNAFDEQFYKRFCAGATSVLELGSGSGRLLRALARPGRSLVGLERDASLRKLSRRVLGNLSTSARAGIEVKAGDMQRFALGRKFERIVLPYNGLYCLLTARSVLDCLRSVRAHLAPGGSFAFDVWRADTFHREIPDRACDVAMEPIVTIEHDLGVWDVFEQSVWHKPTQRLDVTYSYRMRGSRRTRSIHIAQRYLLLPELRELVKRAGLRWFRCDGDFRGGRLGKHAEQLVVQLKHV